jgi:hypothetical protein
MQGQEPPGLQDEEAARLLVACSGKMAMLAAMLPRLLSDGHRVLIFSQLKGVLTLLEVNMLGKQQTLALMPAPICPAGSRMLVTLAGLHVVLLLSLDPVGCFTSGAVIRCRICSSTSRIVMPCQSAFKSAFVESCITEVHHHHSFQTE